MDKIKASELYKSLIKHTEEAFMFETEDYEKEVKKTFNENEKLSTYKEKLMFLKLSKIQAKHLQISLARSMVNMLCDKELIERDVMFDFQYKELSKEAIKETHDYWDQYFK